MQTFVQLLRSLENTTVGVLGLGSGTDLELNGLINVCNIPPSDFHQVAVSSGTAGVAALQTGAVQWVWKTNLSTADQIVQNKIGKIVFDSGHNAPKGEQFLSLVG